jgi:hypothetical protein
MTNNLFIERLFLKIAVIIFLAAAMLSGLVTAEEPSSKQGQEMAEKPQITLITPWEVKNRPNRYEPTIIVDVRPRQEYDAMHISGSISIPLDKIETMVGVFPRDMATVFY